MYEVYAITRPGRPTVLLLIVAAVLAIALGLAWLQVRAARALGPQTEVEGTPLVVQPPLGWVQGRDPGLFAKVIRKQIWGRDILSAERSVEFHYGNYAAQFDQMFRIAALFPATTTSIAGFDGVQYVVQRPSSQIEGETVYRWATTPSGALLGVEYNPLAEASHGDIYLLDDICGAMHLTDAEPTMTSAQILDRAGISLSSASEWTFLGPDNQQGPGFWILGVNNGQPIWAMGIFRRYLGPQGKPIEILADEALKLWRMFEQPRARRRSDGTYVGVVLSPGRGSQAGVVSSLWLIAKSSVESAVIYVLTAPQFADQADQSASQVAEILEFTSEYPR